MRPLNRPMFRYGGPIKEGIMDGIREPKKNGGLSKQFNTGLVGDERYPKTDGRSHHVAFLAPIAMAGLRLAARPFGRFVAQRVPKMFAGPKRTFEIGKGYGSVPGYTKKVADVKFQPNQLGLAFKNDPLAQSVMTGSGFIGRGIKGAGKGVYKAGKYAFTTPSGLTLLGVPVTYQAGKYFLPDGKEIKDPNDIKQIKQTGRTGTSGAPGGGDPGMFLTPQAKGGEGATLSKEELRKKRVERYRDIMDIKGMNRDAAYKSLIDASKLIGESGDFKGDIKSGKLINEIIQATSKQFDKPSKTKDAIDTLILKGEIEKDIKASDPSSKIANELNLARIDKLNKELEGNSFAEAKAVMRKAGSKGQAEITDAAKSLESVDYQGTLISKSDFKEVIETAKNTAKDQGGTLSEEEIIEGFATNFIAGKNAPDGEYVVGDAIISIRDGQVVPGSVRR